MASNLPSLTLDPKLFDPSSITEESKAYDAALLDAAIKGPQLEDVGIIELRRLRAAGLTHHPASVPIPSAIQLEIPTRDSGRTLPSHVLRPQNGKSVRGTLMHIHGGGWALGDHIAGDQRMQDLANEHGLACVSVGYRLTPEHRFPAGIEDCYDAAEWLATEGVKEVGGPLWFIGGESAGGHLSVLVALHLLTHVEERFASIRLKGLLLNYGCYSLVPLPNVVNLEKTLGRLTLTKSMFKLFVGAAMPDADEEQLRHPGISPLYADLEALRGKLPPAIFTCGTRDILLDDTLFMSARWLAAGGETVVEIVTGAQHGFITGPKDIKGSGAAEGIAAVDKFIAGRM